MECISNTIHSHFKPPTQRALVLPNKQANFELVKTAIPKPGSGEVLVKIRATGLNPLDWKVQKYGYMVQNYPTVLGCEGAGTVEEVGEGVTSLSRGDKVFFQGMFSPEKGTFQQYATVPADLAAEIPENISFDQAASLPVGFLTAAIGLYIASEKKQGAGLTPPWEGGEGKYKGEGILVFGGATAVGQYVIQLAKLSGFTTIAATASLHNAELLKSLGATHVIDRKSDIAAEAKNTFPSPPRTIFDTISGETQEQAWTILAPGGSLVLLQEPKESLKGSKDDKKFGRVFGSSYAHREFAAGLQPHITKYLTLGNVIPTKVEVLPNGLAGVVGGLTRSYEGKVSAVKLIARPQEAAD